MLGGSEFRLHQGFVPQAQNACTAQKRRPTVWGPGLVGIYSLQTRQRKEAPALRVLLCCLEKSEMPAGADPAWAALPCGALASAGI